MENKYSECKGCRHRKTSCTTCTDAGNFAPFDRVDSSKLFKLISDLISAGFCGSSHDVVVRRITEYLCTAKALEQPHYLANAQLVSELKAVYRLACEVPVESGRLVLVKDKLNSIIEQQQRT